MTTNTERKHPYIDVDTLDRCGITCTSCRYSEAAYSLTVYFPDRPGEPPYNKYLCTGCLPDQIARADRLGFDLTDRAALIALPTIE